MRVSDLNKEEKASAKPFVDISGLKAHTAYKGNRITGFIVVYRDRVVLDEKVKANSILPAWKRTEAFLNKRLKKIMKKKP